MAPRTCHPEAVVDRGSGSSSFREISRWPITEATTPGVGFMCAVTPPAQIHLPNSAQAPATARAFLRGAACSTHQAQVFDEAEPPGQRAGHQRRPARRAPHHRARRVRRQRRLARVGHRREPSTPDTEGTGSTGRVRARHPAGRRDQRPLGGPPGPRRRQGGVVPASPLNLGRDRIPPARIRGSAAADAVTAQAFPKARTSYVGASWTREIPLRPTVPAPGPPSGRGGTRDRSRRTGVAARVAEVSVLTRPMSFTSVPSTPLLEVIDYQVQVELGRSAGGTDSDADDDRAR